MGADFGQNVTEVGVRIMATQLTTGDQAANHGRTLGAAFTAGKQPILTFMQSLA